MRSHKETNEGDPGPCWPDGVTGPRQQEHIKGALCEGDEHGERLNYGVSERRGGTVNDHDRTNLVTMNTIGFIG